MVEAIGTTARLLGRTVTPAAPVSAAKPASAPVGGDEARIEATRLAQELATSAPVDHERVARIKAAIASGNYPIAPETIADRLLALRLDWRPGA